MGRTRGRVTFAVVAAAHAALFVLLAVGLRPKIEPASPDLAVAPVYLAEIRRKARAQPARPPADAAQPLTVLNRPAETAAHEEAPVTAAAPGDGPRPDVDGQRLARTLRAGGVGCAHPSLLSEGERLACEDRMVKGSEVAKYIPTPIPPERRAFYDAVAREKASIPASAVVRSAGAPPMPAAGLTGALASEARGVRAMGGQAAGLGCRMAFGGPKRSGGWKTPPNGLKLGPLPCYVTPPTSRWTPEANIQNPDEVVKRKD